MNNMKITLSLCLVVLLATIAAGVRCPDNSVCPGEFTCCEADVSDYSDYGCCAYQNAVCCPDRKHCCPSATTCDSGTDRCSGSAQPMHKLTEIFFKK